MKTKKLTPRNVAPVKRENVATVATDGNAIAPFFRTELRADGNYWVTSLSPFAGDEAE